MRILVVDDDEKITRMLRRSLSFEGFDVDTAHNGKQALACLTDKFDLIILDIVMPGLNGLQMCHQLRSSGNDTPILMLTARDEIRDRVLGLEAGADDYLIKPFAYEELLARVRALLRRRQAEKESIIHFADLELNIDTWETKRGERLLEPLSTTEFELLKHFMRHPRQVLRREQILESVWGYDFNGKANVLEIYVGYLRKKMEAAGETRLIQTIRGTGYALREE